LASFHLVNIWTDPDIRASGFNPMAPSLLWTPEGHGPGGPGPAFIFVHRWGGYPYDGLAQELGPALADRGFVFLSVCMRRRGMEGQMTAVPDNDLRDVKLAVDYLQTNGRTQIFLLGDEIGGLSALRYQAKTRDQRVAGVALIDPVDDADDFLRARVGEGSYGAAVRRAGVAVRQRAGMDVRIDLLPEPGPKITQHAAMFLSWWGPMADTKLTRSLDDSPGPLLILGDSEAALPQCLRLKSRPGRVQETCYIHRDDYATKLSDWAGELGAMHLKVAPLEVVQARSTGKALFGLLWTPADGIAVKTAILLMHGLTSSPLSSLFARMGPVLAQTGAAALAIETHRSGYWGHETALIDDDNDALDVWIELLLERGFERIVLAGASMGSLSIGRYQSMRQHPNVAALAHLMPTADCPEWFRAAAGDEDYEKAVALATEAVAQGRGAEVLMDIDVRQPPPSLFGSYFRWTQRAASWLSWWGPDADSRNSRHIANAKVPILLLAGTDDSYNDKARFAELKAAAGNAPSVDEIWYQDVDHGLAGVETRVAQDLITWLRKVRVLDGGAG
jgi:alpha-beta hydrolase superfamily lysophospholipase